MPTLLPGVTAIGVANRIACVTLLIMNENDENKSI